MPTSSLRKPAGVGRRRERRRTCGLTIVSACVVAGWVSPANAELVQLSTGRTLSVRSAYIDAGGAALLLLRSGGVVSCPVGLIAKVSPDEVAYPDVVAVDIERGAALAALLARAQETTTDRPFDGLVQRAAAVHQVDVNLIHAVIAAESGYRAGARSPKGAMGLMQLMPALAREYGVARPFDPEANIEAGVRHLRNLLTRFTLPVALAAYNAGEGAVARFKGIPPFSETRQYVDRVVRTFEALKAGVRPSRAR